MLLDVGHRQAWRNDGLRSSATRVDNEYRQVTLMTLAMWAEVLPGVGMTVRIYAIDAKDVGGQIGTIQLSETKAGLRISPRLAGLPPGQHGFHLHVNPSCDPGAGPNGQAAAGLAAGGHCSDNRSTPMQSLKAITLGVVGGIVGTAFLLAFVMISLPAPNAPRLGKASRVKRATRARSRASLT
jgi:hypothetical protein